MEIIVNTKEVQTALKNLNKITLKPDTKNKASLILSNIKVEADNNIVTLTATDITVTTCVTLKNAEIIDPGSVLLSKDTVKLITKLSDFEMTITDKTIESGKRTVNYSSMDVLEYPKDPKRIYNQKAFTLNNTSISNLLNVTYTSSKSETTPVLQGVLIRKNLIIATDRHRLSVNKLEDNQYEKDIVIPAYAVDLIPTFADKKYKGEYSFTIDKNESHIHIAFDNVTMEVRLIEGVYPDVSKIIPNTFKTEAKLNKVDIMNELTILKEVVTDKTKILKINVSPAMLTLLGESESNSLESNIESIVTGEDIKIAANLEFILEALKMSDKEQVTLKFTGPTSPLMIDDSALILPYRISA